ncbi:putative transcription factor WD40-like family [Lupinus albus]|uniref:Putative transcription factor WD40-like family n=1 Tax=Lupinus albus TaxID=3870 RepID=A0A6A4QJB2_LUPAL|nr:putative transcription factor WD40-like family [Lupinus albus]
MTSITSVELNFMVFRYLHESGFLHSAFTFGYEAGIDKSPIDGNSVPPGALVSFVQKGLQYFEMEANLNNSDADLEEDFLFLKPMDLITKDVDQLRQLINERRKNRQKDKNKGPEKEHVPEHGRVREKGKRKREKEVGKDRKNVDKVKEQDQLHGDRTGREMVTNKDDKVEKIEKSGAFGGPEPMDVLTTSISQPCAIPSSDRTVLQGHTSEVCACAWSPTGSLLASGSGDSTARIWTIAEGKCKTASQKPLSAVVLKHGGDRTNEKNKDVTTLDWNGEGTLLATGSYDGQARIWTTTGELRSTFNKHKGPIFSLKWNKKGDYLLTGSFDKTAIVWNVKTSEWKQQFEFHSGPTLDVDWRNNVSFATSSSDHMIHVCKIGDNRPVKTFAGHKGEVNCVKWDPTSSMLASCSDDSTVKIWTMSHDKHLRDLREHSKEIYIIRWSPTGVGTSNPNKKLVLASASFDSTVKIWDVELGKSIYSLNGHRDPVYSVAFSPNGEYIASGSLDKSVHIWSLKDGKIVKTYSGNGGTFEVCWNKEGDKLAASFADNTVSILDFRM